MNKSLIKRVSALAALALILAGCGGASDEMLLRYTKSKGLTEVQTQAFMACANATRANKPVLPGTQANSFVRMTKVPFDVCLCQSSAILATFAPKQYKNYTKVAEYLAREDKTKKKPPRFGKKALQDGVKPKEATPRLEKNFASCVNSWTKAHEEEAKLVFEPVAPPEPAPDKTKKTASTG